MDEHDNEEPLLTALDENTLIVDARLEIEKLEEHLKIEFPEGDFESVGGFIIHLVGRIPKVNEKITFEDLEITIQKADQRKIDNILISRQDASDTKVDENEVQP